MERSDLQQEQYELGVSPETVCTEAGVSMTSLYKVYAGKHVRPKTELKVKAALQRIRARLHSRKFENEPMIAG
jgi:hypothetical protein